MHFRGVAYRAHNPRWSFDALSGEGASIHGGRFNEIGTPALYLSLERETAIAEASQGFAEKIRPLTIVSYEIDCRDIFDLTDEAALSDLGVDPRELANPWQRMLARADTPPTWKIARRLIERGAAGIKVRSFLPSQPTTMTNLVLWDWSGHGPHMVKLFDPEDDLPKDQHSWT